MTYRAEIMLRRCEVPTVPGAKKITPYSDPSRRMNKDRQDIQDRPFFIMPIMYILVHFDFDVLGQENHPDTFSWPGKEKADVELGHQL